MLLDYFIHNNNIISLSHQSQQWLLQYTKFQIYIRFEIEKGKKWGTYNICPSYKACNSDQKYIQFVACIITT